MRSEAAPPAVSRAAPLPLLREQRISAGERWIFSAGFNVGPGLPDTTRIDCEVPDLLRLVGAGARVAVLAHQGSHRDGTARSLEYVAAHLGRVLGHEVGYHPGSTGDGAVERARGLRDGEVVLFGNTRQHAGEEADDPELARQFALLGDRVAVGGFSKAHRVNASNTGILRHRPGWAADSLLTETEALAPWAGRAPGTRSLAVLGGVKPEKTLIGLRRLTETYDVVVPGGVVLNTLLRVLGHEIGRSEMGQSPGKCAEAATRVLSGCRAEIHLPERLVVRGPDGAARTVDLADGVPSDCAIVDFELPARTRESLRRLREHGGRALMAGTPCRWTDGFGAAARPLLDAFAAPAVRALLLGGDTVAELPWDGPVSGGGGSALQYLADGTCAVFDALRSQHSTERTTTP
ncbi:phosphoglycerate kinase [Streptomyces sp. NPDC052040]|uniref:phosphoglycerate kinase n=1 Tax=unclassified Streptomyces TaxID=2593676 RepID=UPI0037D19EA3